MKRIALILFAGLVLVAACSDKAEDHNAQDVTFAQEMIPHHQQAVEMADMAPAKASSDKVKDLAGRIKAAQGPEMATMKGWLSTWGEPAEASSSGGMAGMDHGGGDMAGMAGMGMMTDAQMKELGAAGGAEFDRMFLTMMIAHHEGAVAMARTELEKGKFQPAKQLAQSIIDGQQKEITEMRGLLSGGY